MKKQISYVIVLMIFLSLFLINSPNQARAHFYENCEAVRCEMGREGQCFMMSCWDDDNNLWEVLACNEDSAGTNPNCWNEGPVH